MTENKENMNLSALPDKNVAEENRKKAEGQKEAEKKLKRKETVHAYYLRNRERIKERARKNYYRKLEERKKSEETARISAEKLPPRAEKSQKSEIRDEKGGIPLLLILSAFAGTVLIFLILTKPDSPEPPKTPQPSQKPPSQKYKEFDIGNGRIIKIPTDWEND